MDLEISFFYQAEDNQKALARLKKILPVAWQHIHFQLDCWAKAQPTAIFLAVKSTFS